MKVLAPILGILFVLTAARGDTASVSVTTPPIRSVDADVCIYGGTSGGVIAAVQAARMGKSVCLIAEGKHVGGMTSGGLGNADTGTIDTIGGLAREFFRRVGAHYGMVERFRFEPQVAEDVFTTMLAEVGVTPKFSQRLQSVRVGGGKIISIRTTSGTFTARQFIDATYEGELMARARVPFTFGREAIATYGESLAGARRFSSASQFPARIDPYRIPGRADSGVLTSLRSLPATAIGTGDRRIQAYNYRLCLTANPGNRLPITKPPGYSERNYALAQRYIQTAQQSGRTLRLADLLYFAQLPNQKFDVNSIGPVSTDCPGLADAYPLATDSVRPLIALRHRRYIQGFLFYLGNSPQVPLEVRTEMLRYGLAADEFTDNDGWPHQLYVRECRRMLGDYVIQQSDCEGRRRATDPIALGSYPMDCHTCQRVIDRGAITNEGEINEHVAQPYGISYRAIIPPTGSITNLHITFALSASHVAFSSIRMEPVFMALSQSAATAAVLAIEDQVPVQQLAYRRLATRLRADAQILQWPLPPHGPSQAVAIVDNSDAGAVSVGEWATGAGLTDFFGVDYVHHGRTGEGTKHFRFTPTLAADGDYDIYLRWPGGANRARRVPVEIADGGGVRTHFVDQRPAHRGWVLLARARLTGNAPGSVTIRTSGADGYVVADAVAWVRVGSATEATVRTADPLPGDFPE